MTAAGGTRNRLHGRTAAAAPRFSALRGFLRTEAGGAVVLLAAPGRAGLGQLAVA